MRGQDGEIDGADPASAAKENNTDMPMIVEVRGQEEAGSDNSCEHTRPMSIDLAAMDKTMSGGDQQSTDGVERCIQCRKNRVVGAGARVRQVVFSCG